MVENAAQRLEFYSPENVQALSFCAPDHLRLWLAEVSCIANMIYLLCTVQWHLQSILLPGPVCILNEIIYLFLLPFPCIWDELCLSAVLWEWLSLELGIPSPRWLRWPWHYAEQWPRRPWGPFRHGEPWCCLKVLFSQQSEKWEAREWDSATSHAGIAHFHHSGWLWSCADTPGIPLEDSHPLESLIPCKSRTGASPSPGVWGFPVLSEQEPLTGAGGAAVQFCASYRAESSQEIKIATLVSVCKR